MPSILPWRLLIVVASCAAALMEDGLGVVVAKVSQQQFADRNLQTYSATDKYQATMLAAVNAERAKQGLTPFCTSKKLQAAAQLHSDDQAKNNFMSHTGSNGSKMSQRITAQGFVWSSIAENVAAGQVDVAAVVAAWMISPGHRANILGNYKFFGTGYAYNAQSTYKHYWTQDFGASSSEVCDTDTVVTPAPTTAAPATPKPTTPAPTTARPMSMQVQMLNAVNAERIKVGLSALCTNKKLQAAAQLHSDDQAANNFMGHAGSNGSKMSQRITAQGFIWSGIAENVAAGQVDVAAVVAAWMTSPGHRANILGTYTFFGMGYGYNVNSKYKRYWTQNFGRGDKEVCD